MAFKPLNADKEPVKNRLKNANGPAKMMIQVNTNLKYFITIVTVKIIFTWNFLRVSTLMAKKKMPGLFNALSYIENFCGQCLAGS